MFYKNSVRIFVIFKTDGYVIVVCYSDTVLLNIKPRRISEMRREITVRDRRLNRGLHRRKNNYEYVVSGSGEVTFLL